MIILAAAAAAAGRIAAAENSKEQQTAMPGKPRGRPFKKGQSGNPGGRPKEEHEVKELARQYTPAAIKRLAFWMRSPDSRASVPACIALLDRGWGRPHQENTV